MAERSPFDLSNRVFYLFLIFVAGISLFFAFKVYEIWRNSQGQYPREFTVEGTGTAYAIPDIATVTLGVNTEGDTSDVVVQENTKKINAIIAALEALGVEKKDIKTTQYYLNPQYDWTEEGGSQQSGYILDQSVTVTVRNFEILDEVIGASTKAGANTVGGVNFALEDDESVKAQAREEAVAEAKAKIQVIAEQTGLRAGRIINYWEYTDYYGGEGGAVEMMDSVALDASSPNIEPGEEEVNLTVNLTFRLK